MEKKETTTARFVGSDHGIAVRLRGERNEDQRGICGGLEDGDGFGELVLKFRDSGKQRNYFSRRDRCLRMKRRGGINRAVASNVGFSNLWQ